MATTKKGGASRGGSKGSSKSAGGRGSSSGKSGGRGSSARGSSKKSTSSSRGSSKSSSKKSSSSRGGSSKASSSKKSGPAKKRTPNAAFMKPMRPSDQLATIVGSDPAPRTEITKRLWDYIKRNNLQDPKQRRMINADENLRPIFKKDQVSMFDMTKLVNKHLNDS